MKRKPNFFLILMLAGAMLFVSASCVSAPVGPENKHLKIVATVFPIYDWASHIAKDTDTEVTLLMDSGVDLHSFQPSVKDILTLTEADLFLYVGGESDQWIQNALKQPHNPDRISLNLLETLGTRAKQEETVEGMEKEDDEEDQALDEHIWLSLKNAEVLTEAIRNALSSLDPENRAVYESNAETYCAALDALDRKYEAAVRKAKVRTLLFGDRFPFRYLTDDYGLRYYAAFSGCSAETEASFETVRFLAEKADEYGLKAVLTIEGADKRLAETIIRNTASKSLKILSLDSMQSINKEDVLHGADYLAVMEKNLEVLKKALE